VEMGVPSPVGVGYDIFLLEWRVLAHFERAGVDIALTACSFGVFILLQTDFTTETG